MAGWTDGYGIFGKGDGIIEEMEKSGFLYADSGYDGIDGGMWE